LQTGQEIGWILKALFLDREKLDINYITEHLTPLCELKESPEIIDKLQNIIKDIL